ncbi:single-strand DNA-binding protein [Acetoanaerobium pronyense]|uniref:Single-stranded DNA-binding protein n=1 Tax=Acetoanaerobium pronyense TaxID=1482736 RepID=A0ABS4KI20_9FIRM|nr:single-stranded DNA-binding protein [Acetoanaerobium pronyense]MBP2027423.1 single-strand DNA-binding protein [Acetoanaerobium pronyense]
MNSIILIGRLTKDPELRFTSAGKAVCNFDLAVDRPFIGKDGQKQTDFFKIQVWGKSAENCANYLVKGRLVAIKGYLQNRSYENAEGQKRYVTEIVAENVQFLEYGDKKESSNNNNTFEPTGLNEEGFRALDDDGVPF